MIGNVKARRDGFILWYAAQVLTDIDPAFPTLDGIFVRYELSLEQQYWVAFLYAVFYENASVFLVMQVPGTAESRRWTPSALA